MLSKYHARKNGLSQIRPQYIPGFRCRENPKMDLKPCEGFRQMTTPANHPSQGYRPATFAS